MLPEQAEGALALVRLLPERLQRPEGAKRPQTPIDDAEALRR